MIHTNGQDALKISVVGDLDTDTLGKLLDSTFGSLPAKAELTPVPAIEAAKPPQRTLVTLDVPQTVVMFGGPGIKRDDPDFMAAFVANHILGGGSFSSRLYREVREKRGLAYSVYEQLLWMKQSAIFKEILAITKEQFYTIGVSTSPDVYGLVKNNFHNVPESMVGAYLYPTPGPSNPVQYYMDPA